MTNSASAYKRSVQSEKRRQRNAGLRSSFRTAVKKVREAIRSGNAEEALVVFRSSVSTMDSISRKGIVHSNKVSRHKSRLISQIKALSSQQS